MCGLFGYSLSRPMPLTKACRILERLETNQLPEETRPLGGYGASMAVILEDGTAMIEKVGHVSASPAVLLTRMVKIGEASVLLGHVEMPSPEFMRTVKFKETALHISSDTPLRPRLSQSTMAGWTTTNKSEESLVEDIFSNLKSMNS